MTLMGGVDKAGDWTKASQVEQIENAGRVKKAWGRLRLGGLGGCLCLVPSPREGRTRSGLAGTRATASPPGVVSKMK